MSLSRLKSRKSIFSGLFSRNHSAVDPKVVRAARAGRVGLLGYEALEPRRMLTNTAPTLTTIDPLAGAVEDTAYTISYATLAGASDVDDVDGDTIKFKITAVSTGTLKKNGTLVTGNATLVGSADVLTWTGAANANGTLNAFTVKANDGSADSSTAVQVQIITNAVNDAPTLTSVTTLTAGTEDTAYAITYASLKAAGVGYSDVDSGDPEWYQVAAFSTGKLTKNGVTVNLSDPALNTLKPGETWNWTPVANANGTLNAFTVKSFDGTATSTIAAQVKVTVAAVNDAPTLTRVNTISGATEDTAFSVTYSGLVSASDIADVDSTTTQFRIEAVSSGTLKKGGVAVTAGTTTITTGDVLVWTPAADANGTVPAFTVKAFDGTVASGTAIQVNITTAAVNDAPTLTAVDNLANGTEDMAYDISWSTLVGDSDAGDVDSTTIGFKIVAVSTGTLFDGSTGSPIVVGTVIHEGDELNWVPAANANGLLNAFTVKANDGTTDSATAIQVKVNVTAGADAPTLTAVTTLTAATEDTAYSITYANFLAAANEADVDGNTISFRIESVTSGTLTKGGVAVTPGTTTFATGETLVWTPATNANGSALAAFTVRATDGTYYSTPEIPVTVAVAAANDAPTLTHFNLLPGATEDTAFTISYATLKAASDASDVDGGAFGFQVTTVSGGTLTKNGTAVVQGTTVINAADSLVWTPAANTNGIRNAFTVKAYDGTVASSGAVQVQVSVASANDNPQLGTISNLTGATEDTAFNITYAALVTAAGAGFTDIDNTNLGFQVTALGTGTLTKNGIPVTAGLVISTGDTVVWTPAANANGTGTNGLNAFSVKATDGALLSATAVPVLVNVTGANDAPSLSTISTLAGATEDTAFTITYAALAAASNATDIEGPIQFRIEAISSGTLTKGGAAVTAGTTTLATGETLSWKGAQDANGTLNAFTVKAYDGSLASSTAIQVKVTATAVNDAPTLTTISNLAGGTEDTAYTITYAALAAAANDADPDNTPSFQVSAVTSGTLTKNGSAVVAGTTLLSTGESLVWTPASNVSGTGTGAFTVKLTDGTATSATAIPVKVDVTAVNDVPTLTTFTNLTGASEDTNYSITYAALKTASNVADVENGTITFRIEQVLSGTLTKNGSAVTAGTTTIAAGDTVVWKGAADAYGTLFNGLPAFSVKAYDGTGYSTAAIAVKVDTANVNDAPTLTTMTTFTAAAAATEDTAYPVTYANLLAASNAADIDNTVVAFQVAAVSTGTLTKNGAPVVAGTTLLSPGEIWYWTPAANAAGSAVNAFTVKAWDGALASSTAVQVKADVTAVNDVPTLNATGTFATATEDVALTITYAQLVTASGAADAESDTITFTIESVSSGTLTKGGVAVVAGTDTLGVGQSLVWTGASNVNGTVNAFTVSASDGTGSSALPDTQIKVTMAAVNDATPTLGSPVAITGGTEDSAVTISFAALATAAPATDPDTEQSITYKINSITAGSTLTKNGVAVTVVGASGTAVAPGDVLVWTPGANINGAASPAFSVLAYDGIGNSSAPATVGVNLAAVNDAPTLTSTTLLAGGTEDTALSIDFTDITTNAADIDADTISYVISGVVNGTLTKGGSAVVPGTTTFATGDTIVWTPSADVNGTIPAFTLKSSDGTLFSSTPVTLNVTVAAAADAPALTSVATLTTGVQNTPLTITYGDLVSNSDIKDADGTVPSFKIISVTTGTLTKNGTAVVAGTTLISAGDTVVWTPALNAAGAATNAFKVRAWDGALDNGADIQVKVNIAAVNQAPTLTTMTTLTGGTEDTAFTILYADLVAAGNQNDVESDTLSFRIESVLSGTLTKGGTAVVPGVTLVSTGDTLIWTPALNANGSAVSAFTVRAATTSPAAVSTTPVAVKVAVAAANDTPKLTAIAPLSGAGEDLPYSITYASLLAASDLKDVDGDPITFTIEAVSSGTLVKGVTPVTPGTTVIAPGDTVIWTGAANANGLLNAFTTKATDGTATSATAIQVKVNVTPINDAPTLTAFTTLTGATKDTPLTITFANLTTAGDQADTESQPLSYVVKQVLSGTLTLNGKAVIPGVTRIKTGQSLVWTPAANYTGTVNAFTLYASDGQTLSASAVAVGITVT